MAKAARTTKITHAVVRMYCMGTGDCFIVKFFSGTTEKFKLMIDCGVWTGSKAHLTPYIKHLKEYVKNSVDLLVVTHEHKDHVSVFESCKELFTKDFQVKKIWMGWAENDSLSKIKRWKTEHGDKKKALALAADKMKAVLDDPQQAAMAAKEMYGVRMLEARKTFAASIKNFADLHVQAVAGNYVGMLEGMRIVKQELTDKENIEYYYPGDIIEDIPGLKGVKFYVLGPPEKWAQVETEGGEDGETYTHNKELKGTDAFAASILHAATPAAMESILPFDDSYETRKSSTQKIYQHPENQWRNIETDWLYSAGSLALRINSLTNNLSLALAIEFEDSKRVMLFPGDAEFGSWSSWHTIPWQGVKPEKEGIHFTQDLLRRTVFYKVAHHMSHNGTAQRLGLEMMEDKDLAAMATLDYDVIAPAWRNTMPNREMLQELLARTRGRVMIMKEDDIYYDFKKDVPLKNKIKEAQKKMSTAEKTAFDKAFKREKNNLFIDFTVRASG